MKRCLVADDNPDVRSALRLLLETRFDQIEVSEAADGAQLFDRLAAAPPDCLILDGELLERDALDRIRQIAPGVRIVVTSARLDAAIQTLAAQADAFVAQTDAPAILVAALLRLGL